MAKKAARSRTRTTTLGEQREPERGTATDAPAGFLIAVELGASWPSLALEASERRVQVQLEGETPAAFADRVAQSLDSLFGRGVELYRVALACNERIDAAADQARRTLVGLVLGAMAARHAGQVLLTAPPRSSERLRRYLDVLAAGARHEWHGAGLDVSTDFGREAASAPAPAAAARVA